MASFQSFLVYIFLSSVLQSSYSLEEDKDMPASTRRKKGLDELLKDLQIPITLPDGFTANNTVVETYILKDCKGMEKQLDIQNKQLQEKNTRITQLELDVFGVKRDLRQLRLECGSGCVSAVQITSWQAQLNEKMRQLEEDTNSDAYLFLQIIKLTYEVNQLKEQTIRNKDSVKVTELLQKLEVQNNQLRIMTEKLKKNDHNSQLVLKIIELQTQIWDLQSKSSTQDNTKNILALQRELEGKIRDLEDNRDDHSKSVLSMISCQTEIFHLERRISELTEFDSAQDANLQKQFKEKSKQLHEKILELLDRKNDTAILDEIKTLQNDVLILKQEMLKHTSSTNEKLSELEKNLKTTKERRDNQINQLQQRDNANYDLVMTIIYLMRQTREFQSEASDHNQTTVATIAQITDLQRKLKAKEHELARAQAQVRAVQNELKDTDAKCSGLQEKFNSVKSELDKKIEELGNKSEAHSKLVTVLQLITLNTELKVLRRQAAATEEPTKLADLQNQLELKNQELNLKTRQLNKLSSNPQRLLRVIALLNLVWDHENNAVNETTFDQMSGLQKELDSLIDDVEEKVDDNTKLMLRIYSLQIEVALLQKLQSEDNPFNAARKAQLMKLLETKEAQLEGHVEQLKSKDRLNADLNLKILDLQRTLRKIQNQSAKESQASDAEIAALKKQLQVTDEENFKVKNENKDLLKRLKTECFGVQEKYDRLQEELDQKLIELNNKTDSIDGLIVQVSALKDQVERLQERLLTPEEKNNIAQLQQTLAEKNKELEKKTYELQQKSSQHVKILRIIELQHEIRDLQNGTADDQASGQIAELEKELNTLIDGIQDKKNENSKFVLRIIALQNELASLRRQVSDQSRKSADRTDELENEIEKNKYLLQKNRNELTDAGAKITDLTNTILTLHHTLRDMEIQLHEQKERSANRIAELKRLVEQKNQQLEDNAAKLRASNAKNADLMLQITSLQMKMKDIQNGAVEVKQAVNDEITGLKNQLKAKEKENKRLGDRNQELENLQRKKDGDCVQLNRLFEELQSQYNQAQKDLIRMQREKNDSIQRLEQEAERNQIKYRKLEESNKSLQEQYESAKRKIADLQSPLNNDDQTIHITKVSLDPETANSKIILSADNTVMTISDDRIAVPDNPGRFDTLVAVLGKVGFTKGRHYWEVDVRDQPCYNLGVASETATRKGIFSVKPRNGYWTLIFDRKSYRALEQDPINLRIQTAVNKIGVLLDYKRGYISFYDATRRSPMYTFTGNKFTHKLHPFIHACLDTGKTNAQFTFSPVEQVDWIE